MPRSRHDPADTLLPETPDGYSDPEPFEYSMLVVTGLALLLLYLGMVGFGWVLFEAHEPGALEPLVTVDADEAGFTMAVGSPQFLAAFVAAVVVLVVVHEAVHGLVYGLRGYDVSYGVAPQLGAVYAAAFHQFQTREE